MLFLVWRAHDQEIENYHQLTKLKDIFPTLHRNPFQPGWSYDYMWLLGTYKRPRPLVFNPPKSNTTPGRKAMQQLRSRERKGRASVRAGGVPTGTQWTHLILLQDEWTWIVEKEAIHIKISLCVWQRLKGGYLQTFVTFDAIFGKMENIKSGIFNCQNLGLGNLWIMPLYVTPSFQTSGSPRDDPEGF